MFPDIAKYLLWDEIIPYKEVLFQEQSEVIEESLSSTRVLDAEKSAVWISATIFCATTLCLSSLFGLSFLEASKAVSEVEPSTPVISST